MKNLFLGLAGFDILNCLVFLISGSIPSLLTQWDLTTNKTWPGHPVTYPIGNMAFTGKDFFLAILTCMPLFYSTCLPILDKGGNNSLLK